jgi:hypothetical protein
VTSACWVNLCASKYALAICVYIHRNPVKRGLVLSPELWRWISFRDCHFVERGKVKIGD